MDSSYFSKNVILVNGAFPEHRIPLKILQQAETLICCDGAFNELIKRNISPSIIVGDMDSISAENKNKYKHLIVEIPDQDTNDQTKAINWAIEQGIKDAVILGATGRREDHSIGNIALLCSYVKKIKICTVSNYGIFTPIIENTEFQSFNGQQVSIFSLTPDTEIQSENLKYPLNKLQLNSWWMGTLNESVSESFSIQFDKGELIVFQTFE